MVKSYTVTLIDTIHEKKQTRGFSLMLRNSSAGLLSIIYMFVLLFFNDLS